MLKHRVIVNVYQFLYQDRLNKHENQGKPFRMADQVYPVIVAVVAVAVAVDEVRVRSLVLSYIYYIQALMYDDVMTYLEFQRHVRKAGLTMCQFAELVKMNRVSLSNYGKKGEVPSHLAIIAALLGEMAEHQLDYRAILANIEISSKKPRGAGKPGTFGGGKQKVSSSGT